MWPAIVAGGAAIAGGLIGASGAKKAAQAQAAAAEAATAEQARQFNVARRDQMPWLQAGQGSVNQLSLLMGVNNRKVQSLDAIVAKLRKGGKFGTQRLVPQYDDDGHTVYTPSGGVNEKALMAEANRIRSQQLAARDRVTSDPNFGSLTQKFTMEDFENDPVTQASMRFGLEEGTKALSRMARSRGMYNSGATLKGLTRFAEDYVGQQAGQSRDRFVSDQANLYNRYAGLSGGGQTAANVTGSMGMNYANNVGNLQTGAANARGAASIAGANVVGNALSQAGGTVGTHLLLDDYRPGYVPPTGPRFTLDSDSMSA